MKKYIIAILLLFVSTAAFAYAYQGVSTEGLTDTQKAELALQAAKMKETVDKPAETVKGVVSASDTAADVAKKWGGLGREVATGIVSAAKELGVAANDFAVTPLGRITTAIIVWKMLGKDLVGILSGVLMLAIGLPTLWRLFKYITTDRIEYEYEKGMWGFTKRKVKVHISTNGEAFGFSVVLYVVLNIGLILISLLCIGKGI